MTILLLLSWTPSSTNGKSIDVDSAKLIQASVEIIKKLIEANQQHPEVGRSLNAVISRSIKSRNSNQKIRNPMRPVEPLPVGPLDYFTPVINLINNAKKLEHNLKKQTYSYGLMVVGRPLEELTLPQKFVRAALMPGKYYQDATSDIAKQFNRYILKEKKNTNHFQVKSKSTGTSKNNGLQWANVLLQLINMAANALPTPVVKS